MNNGFKPQKVTYYDNMTEVLAALRSGKVDAAITNILFLADDLNLIGKFSPLPSYDIVQKKNHALLRELNTALIQMNLTDPSFQTNLMSSYFSLYGNSQFSYEEQKYIDSAKEINIGYQVNHSPLSYTDKKTGSFAGVTRDIMDRIEKLSGLHFNYIALPAKNVTADYLKKNKISVVTNVEYNEVNLSTQTSHL